MKEEPMSNLRKTLRALNHCEEWAEIAEAACILEGVEPTRENLMQATILVADNLNIDADTLQVDTSGVSDEAIRAAARTLTPPAPVVEPEKPTINEDEEMATDA